MKDILRINPYEVMYKIRDIEGEACVIRAMPILARMRLIENLLVWDGHLKVPIDDLGLDNLLTYSEIIERYSYGKTFWHFL